MKSDRLKDLVCCMKNRQSITPYLLSGGVDLEGRYCTGCHETTSTVKAHYTQRYRRQLQS
jgi:hypothetical protein